MSKWVPKEYKRWRKNAAKSCGCSKEAIDEGVRQGIRILAEMRRSKNPATREMFKVYCRSMLPVYHNAFTVYLYSCNPTLNLLLRGAYHADSPYVRMSQVQPLDGSDPNAGAS